MKAYIRRPQNIFLTLPDPKIAEIQPQKAQNDPMWVNIKNARYGNA